jgi:tetratricopeptide (TPR) repeat protein
MYAFIVRPFGEKKGINFDLVERTLIGPALDALNIAGRTTAEILEAGNIRADMFQRLLIADLVVADVSIHNANVFYELGIRHALRDKRTFLLRSPTDDYPFDLQTDRYLAYDAKDPAASLKELTLALRRTLDSDAQDSPVFRALPDLREQERSRFLPVPVDFREEVERAADAKAQGDLELLAAEVRGFTWESEGLRVVGRTQFNLGAFHGARETWEAVREIDRTDLEANTLLGTIYQRLGELVQSSQALERALDRQGLNAHERAEIHALLGRNAKTCWQADWASKGREPLSPEQRRQEALRSPWLARSFQSYSAGFCEDLNHYYSGLNALAMLTVQLGLAAALPQVWEERFDAPEEAKSALEALRRERTTLAAGVDLALRANKLALDREKKTNIWLDIAVADHVCLTSQRPPRVTDAYRKALTGVPDFAVDSARAQLKLYQQLDILQESVAAALAAFPPETVRKERRSEEPEGAPRPRILLFTGHMIDAPDRKTPRFPPDKEGIAREAIQNAVAAEQSAPGGVAYGIAGGASGGDTLFHEVCADLRIPTRLFLALPPEAYVKASVAPAGPAWVERFYRLYGRLKGAARVLASSEELPRWLRAKKDYSIWQRNNLWMLYNTLALAAVEEHPVTLIALWNGAVGDGPGGTADVVSSAKARGVKVVILDTGELFGT